MTRQNMQSGFRRACRVLLAACLFFMAHGSAWAARNISTVTIGAQSGTLTYGTSGAATYTVNTTTTGSGADNCTWSVTGLPAGVTASFASGTTISYSNGSTAPSTTLTLTTSVTSPAVTAQSFTVTCTEASSGIAASGNSTITIGKKALTVTADSLSKTYGNAATLTFSTSGLVNSDSVTSATITSAGAAATATVAGSPYTITISAASGTGLTNYTITYVSGTLTVTARPLTITANNQTKTFGNTFTFAGTEFTTSGLANSDTVTSATISSPGAPSGAAVGTYAITISAATGTGLANYTISYVSGVFTVTSAAVSSFNAVETGASATAGKLFTKVAGQNFVLDIVALDASNAIQTSFTGAVTVEVVDNSSGGACSGLPLISSLSNQTFVAGDSGRHALSAGNTTANSWPNAKIRIKYPTASPTVTSCSGDNFAIRPASLVINSVTDLNWTTTGSTRSLTNSALSGAVVHKAGQPFTIAATAYNGAGTPAVTTNYAGNPTATAAACSGAGTACTAAFGTVTTPASWTASSGVVTLTTASYSEVGAFGLQLEDTTFSAVDVGDGSSSAQRNIPLSAKVDVGRFVPDHFAVSYNTPVLTPACGTFSYVGQAIVYATAPVITVTAQNSANATTTNYSGLPDGSSLVKLSNSTGTGLNQTPYDTQSGRYARYDALGGGLTPALSTSGLPATTADPTISTFVAGVGTLTFSSGTGLIFTRSATTPSAPFNGDIALALNILDTDGVAYAGNPAQFGAVLAAGSGIAFTGSNKTLRFGRLQLSNAHGSELLKLRVPVEAQYWNSSGVFVTNTADSCTTLAAANVTMDDYTGGLAACETGISVVNSISAGTGAFLLSAPGNGNYGSVRLRINLGTASGNTCLAAGGAQSAATTASASYLQVKSGANYTADPTARATFGVRRAGPVIYLREMY